MVRAAKRAKQECGSISEAVTMHFHCGVLWNTERVRQRPKQSSEFAHIVGKGACVAIFRKAHKTLLIAAIASRQSTIIDIITNRRMGSIYYILQDCTYLRFLIRNVSSVGPTFCFLLISRLLGCRFIPWLLPAAMSGASPPLGARDVDAANASLGLDSCEGTRRWNGIFEAGQDRWHTKPRGGNAMRCALTTLTVRRN